MAARAKRRLKPPRETRALKLLPPPPVEGAAGPQPARSFYANGHETTRRDLPLDELRRVVETESGQLWVEIDVRRPEQVRLLSEVFHFHPLTIEDTQSPNSRVKVEEFERYLFVVIRGVRFFEETEDPYDLETFNLCFYIGPNYVVTVHGGQSPAIAEATRRLERSPELLQRGAERLAHAIMDAAVDDYFPLLDRIDEFVDGLEERVFQNFDQTALHDIFAVKRVVLSLRRHLAPQREVFNVLTNRPTPLINPDAQVYYRDIYDHVLRLTDSLDQFRELLGSTLDSYLTQVSNNLGKVTKALSVFATVTLPFVVLSGMWGMNVDEIPLAHHAHAFWWMFGIQLGVGAVLLVFLRLRGLL